MEWIKKNKVMVSVMGVGLVIAVVIISVMLLMPKADRGDDGVDLRGDMPENLIIEKGAGDDYTANEVETVEKEVDWSDDLDEPIESDSFDIVLTGLANTVYDESVFEMSSAMTSSYDYVLMDFDVTPLVDGQRLMPSITVMSENFSTTAAGGEPAFYVESVGDDDEVSWTYINPSVGFDFQKDVQHRVIGLLKMSDGTDDEKATMLSEFSFSVFDSDSNKDTIFTVPLTTIEIQLNEQQELIASYIDRAYTCIPRDWFADPDDELIEITRLACLIAESEGVDLGIDWSDPDYYGSTLTEDPSLIDLDKYELYTLETWPEGCWDFDTGEPTEKFKQMFEDAYGISYDEYVQQLQDEYNEALSEALGEEVE